MFYAKKLLSALLLPPAGPILLALWGLWLSRRHPRSGRAVAAAALLGMLALSFWPVAGALMRALEDQPPVGGQELARAQAIVVLGGGKYEAAPEYGGDTVGLSTLARLRYAAFLQKRSALPVLVTGGALDGGRPEAEVMKEAMERDLGGKVRWVEGASLDTADNARFSAPLLRAAGVSRIALVSDAWHLKRAVPLFHAQGLEVLPAPTGFTTPAAATLDRWLPSAGAFEASAQALHEWLGLLAQHALHLIQR
ncbi:MAG TPA: YdcF family protein [Rhodocyclaceae bacterium]